MTRARKAVLIVALALLALVATPSHSKGAASPATLPPVYYQDGTKIYAVNADGKGRVVVATLLPGAIVQPRLLPDGRLLYPTATGFSAVDRYGHTSGIGTPTLASGETVWSVMASPNASTLAWQLVTPLSVNGVTINTGSGRIVLTGRFGGDGPTVFTAQADGSNDGQIPILLGWRRSSPYGAGGATLLLQDLYSANDVQASIVYNTTRGLIEYDPTIDDIVDDYLPPMSRAIPAQRAFTVSADGSWAVYGDANAVTPSGEGPLARTIDALNLNTNALAVLDTATRYPISRPLVTIARHKVGKKVVTTRRYAGMLRLYQYFSHNAYVAPGDAWVLYTRLTVSYPTGAQVPTVQRQTMMATPDGRYRVVVAQDAEGEGWLNSRVVVVQRSTGLYAVNVASHAVTRLASGAGARFIGVRGVRGGL